MIVFVNVDVIPPASLADSVTLNVFGNVTEVRYLITAPVLTGRPTVFVHVNVRLPNPPSSVLPLASRTQFRLVQVTVKAGTGG